MFRVQPSRKTLSFIVFICIASIMIFAQTGSSVLSQDSIGQVIESNDPLVQQDGTWTSVSATEASGGSYLYSAGNASDVLTLQFEGTSVEIVYIEHLAPSNFAIEIDNVIVRTVVATGDSTNFDQRAVVNYLDDGVHTLRIFPIEGVVAIDAFIATPHDAVVLAEASTVWFVDPAGNDANDCQSTTTACESVQGTLDKAVSGDSIFIAPGTYNEAITVVKDVVITGDDQSNTILDGTGFNTSVVTIGSGATVEMSNVTITGGVNGTHLLGGGVFNSGDLTLNDSSITGNSITTYWDVAFGGGLYNDRGATAVLNRVTVADNIIDAIDNGTRDFSTHNHKLYAGIYHCSIAGAGIFVSPNGSVTLNDSVIDHNILNNELPGYSLGAGIATIGGLSVNGTDITDNNAKGGVGTGLGGGIHVGFSASLTTISDSTFTGNIVSGNDDDENGGGGMWVEGKRNHLLVVSITNTTFSENVAEMSGGGLFSRYATTTITNSTFNNNTAMHGAAILNERNLNLANSTLSGNNAAVAGGALLNAGQSYLTHVTMTDNTAGDEGGGIYNESGRTRVQNTIASGNLLGDGSDEDCTGNVRSLGYNTFGQNGDPNDCPNIATDIVPDGPVSDILDPLADNGGPTQTHALTDDSIALDRVPNDNCTFISSANNPDFNAGDPVTTDQRGIDRPFGDACDIGAFETGDDDDGGNGNNGLPPVIKISPLNGDILVNGMVEFSWEHLEAATQYEVVIEDAGSNIIHTQIYDAAAVCTDATCTFTLPLANGVYTWYVRGLNDDGAGEWSVKCTFTVQSDTVLPAVIKISPLNGDVLNDGLVDFVWEVLEGATQYQIVIENSSGVAIHDVIYDAAAVCNTTTCSFSLPLQSGEYTWYARGLNDNGVGAWSVRCTFNIELPLQVPPTIIKIQPASGTTLNDGLVVFTWYQEPTANQYQFWVAKGTQGVIHNHILDGSSICDGSICMITLPLDDGNYTWYVRGINDAGAGNWSVGCSFTVQTVPGAPGYIVQISPKNVTLDDGLVTFVWEDLGSLATQYDFWVGVGGTTLFTDTYDATVVCAASICSVSLPLSDGIYNWWVRGIGPGGVGPWTGPALFTIQTVPGAPGYIVQISPKNVTLDDGLVTFVWEDLGSLATQYDFWVGVGGTVVFRDVYDASAVCVSGTCSVSLPLSDGVYNWWVRGIGPGGVGPWTGPALFTIQTVPGAPGYIVQISPKNVTLDDGLVTFVWEDVGSLATQYDFWVGVGGTVVFRDVYDASAVCVSGTCSISLPLSDGIYNWWVRGIGPGGIGPWTGPALFTIQTLPGAPGYIVQISPKDVTLNDGTVTFVWEDVGSLATQYDFWVGVGGKVVFRDVYDASAVCVSGTCSISLPLSDGIYNWWVRGIGPGGIGPWTGPALFTIQTLPGAPGYIVQISPIDVTLNDGTVTFVWEDVGSIATQYGFWVGVGGTMTFTDIYDGAAVCASGSCSISYTLGDGVFNWWVRGIGPGGVGPWTGPALFTVNAVPDVPGQIVQVSPKGVTLNDSNVTFVWESLGSVATEYEFWVGVGGSTTYTDTFDANIVCSGDTCSISYTLGDGAFNWWVRAIGPGGVGPWTGPAMFTLDTAPDAVVQLSPIDVTLNDGNVTFVWEDMGSIASQYEFWVGVGGTMTFTDLYESTAICDGSTCSVSYTLGDGTFNWWVRAIGPGGDGPWTGPRLFTVDAIPNPLAFEE